VAAAGLVGSVRAGAGAVTTRIAAAAIGVLACVTALPALADLRLAPYKDELFSYPNVLGTMHGDDFVIVEFDQARDVNGRDEIPLKKAFDKFVDLDVNDLKKDVLIRRDGEVVQFLAVGKADGGARIVVIYLHGQHGDRTLAMEDLRFGGNFNRLKNLMARNGGVYVSPDFSSFGAKGGREIKAVMKHYAENSPGAPIFLACASTGCKLIFRLLEDPEAAGLLGGVILHGSLPLGSGREGTLFDVEVFRQPGKQIPIYIGHGSGDPTVPWVTQELFFKKVKSAAPDYPVRFELFKGPDAVHGTPIRMMDWRAVLNWMLAENAAAQG
jgi:dienelactone hydrolase